MTDDSQQLNQTERRNEVMGLAKPHLTIPEQLDAAQTGEEFGQVLQNLFGALEAARGDGE